jgi:hypothetical protein
MSIATASWVTCTAESRSSSESASNASAAAMTSRPTRVACRVLRRCWARNRRLLPTTWYSEARRLAASLASAGPSRVADAAAERAAPPIQELIEWVPAWSAL